MAGEAYVKVTLQLVQLGRKAALCNRINHPTHIDPTVWVPYSLVEDPDRFAKHGPKGEVTIRVQEWFARKEALIKI